MSADSFLGVPFNIASYAFLIHMVASVTGYEPGDLIISFGDLHIYKNHLDQVHKQLMRAPRVLPTLNLNKKDNIFDYVYDDFVIENYNPLPGIPAPIAI